MKCCKSIHVPTVVTSLVNGSLWCYYNVATRDYFISVPNGLGTFLGVSMILYILFPRHRSYGGEGILKTLVGAPEPTRGVDGSSLK